MCIKSNFRIKKALSSLATSSDPCASYIAQTNIADPGVPNCTSFIICLNGVQVGPSVACGPGTKFSFALQTCELAVNVQDCGAGSGLLSPPLENFVQNAVTTEYKTKYT